MLKVLRGPSRVSKGFSRAFNCRSSQVSKGFSKVFNFQHESKVFNFQHFQRCENSQRLSLPNFLKILKRSFSAPRSPLMWRFEWTEHKMSDSTVKRRQGRATKRNFRSEQRNLAPPPESRRRRRGRCDLERPREMAVKNKAQGHFCASFFERELGRLASSPGVGARRQ